MLSLIDSGFSIFFFFYLDAVAVAEKAFNRIEGRIRGTLTKKRFPMVLQLFQLIKL